MKTKYLTMPKRFLSLVLIAVLVLSAVITGLPAANLTGVASGVDEDSGSIEVSKIELDENGKPYTNILTLKEGYYSATVTAGWPGAMTGNGFWHIKVHVENTKTSPEGFNYPLAIGNQKNRIEIGWANVNIIDDKVIFTIVGYNEANPKPWSTELYTKLSDVPKNASKSKHNDIGPSKTFGLPDTNEDGYIYLFFHSQGLHTFSEAATVIIKETGKFATKFNFQITDLYGKPIPIDQRNTTFIIDGFASGSEIRVVGGGEIVDGANGMFTLYSGARAVINGLAPGTYKITETLTGNVLAYTTSIDIDGAKTTGLVGEATVIAGESVSVAYENERPRDAKAPMELSVKKILREANGNNSTDTTDFTFEVRKYNGSGVPVAVDLGGYTTEISGGALVAGGVNGEFTLKNGGIFKISGSEDYCYTNYIIQEIIPDPGINYTTIITNGIGNANIDNAARTIKILESDLALSKSIVFTNTKPKPPPVKGELLLKKIATGAAAGTFEDIEFEFNVVFTGPDLTEITVTGTPAKNKWIRIDSNVWRGTLRDGEAVTFENVPLGTTMYEIYEEELTNWEIYAGLEDTFTQSKTITVENKYVPLTEPPETTPEPTTTAESTTAAPTTEPTTEPTVDETTEPATEPATEPTTEPTIDETTEPATPEPTETTEATEATTEAATEVTTAPTTERPTLPPEVAERIIDSDLPPEIIEKKLNSDLPPEIIEKMLDSTILTPQAIELILNIGATDYRNSDYIEDMPDGYLLVLLDDDDFDWDEWILFDDWLVPLGSLVLPNGTPVEDFNFTVILDMLVPMGNMLLLTVTVTVTETVAEIELPEPDEPPLHVIEPIAEVAAAPANPNPPVTVTATPLDDILLLTVTVTETVAEIELPEPDEPHPATEPAAEVVAAPANPNPPMTVTAAPKTSDRGFMLIFTGFMAASLGVIFTIYKKKRKNG
jgi:hypothetical protein